MANFKRPGTDGSAAPTQRHAPPGLSSAPTTDGVQDIEALKKRYDRLSKEKTRAEANLENARTQLEELKKQALNTYGTDDLAQLRLKLQSMHEENERKRAQYQQHLEKIENDLQQIEREYENAGRKEAQ